MRHRKNGFHERAQYCHVQCFYKKPIEKLSRIETVCSRRHSVIEATTPIEKYGTKWVHRGCKEISNAVIVSESSSSYSYEQLLKASLIFEDELFPSEGTDSQQTFESSQKSQQLSIDIQINHGKHQITHYPMSMNYRTKFSRNVKVVLTPQR